MKKTCPHCGASLPDEAAFCPHCAQSVKKQSVLAPPEHNRGSLVRIMVLLAALAAVVLSVLWFSRPRTYDGQGEVIYSGADGTRYQLALTSSTNRYQPALEITQDAEVGGQYRFPVRLYVNDLDSGADMGERFLTQVESVTAEFLPPEGEGAAVCTEPAPSPDYSPDAALVSFVDFTAQEDFTAQMVWTIRMNSGDTIRLRVDLAVTAIRTYDYYPEDAAMDTTEELQALIDEIADTLEPQAVVNLHLPAVTYQGGLVISERSINLYGSTEGDRRTTFTGPVRLEYTSNNWISYLQDIDFRGSGDGIAVSTAARVRAVNCTFANWDTGFLGYGAAWVNVIGCTFADNDVGFRFNSTGNSASHSMYNDNVFRGNGTAVLLENVPTDLELNFQNSLFSGNGTDIDNRCGQPVDVSQATFQ